HAGWRGVAGGILEAGLAMLEQDFRTPVREAHMHMGPAICGRCYEVGREVHEALGLPRPASRGQPVDLRRVLVDRALAGGADPAHLTTSSFCTRCADAPFFSHRGGDAGRQIAVLGITPDDSAPPGGEWLDDHRRERNRQPVEDR
ncbi:MAG: polyphenol oxidase family protein, partial [Gammaproteobacteria bacterium]|nr:polyphenol oxidase family protein [Gammaproteobacteria bacterium]